VRLITACSDARGLSSLPGRDVYESPRLSKLPRRTREGSGNQSRSGSQGRYVGSKGGFRREGERGFFFGLSAGDFLNQSEVLWATGRGYFWEETAAEAEGQSCVRIREFPSPLIRNLPAFQT